MAYKIEDGGSAFPFGQISESTGQPINGCFDPGMTLRDYFAAHAPHPTEQQIASEMAYDRGRNPHNEPHRPYIRERCEIIADLMFNHADAMLKAGKVKS